MAASGRASRAGGRRPRAGAALALAFALAGAFPVVRAGAREPASVPRREDHGDLVVLYLRGSYEAMGRQQAALLGDELRRVYAHQRGEYRRALGSESGAARLAERLVLPVASGLARLRDASGLFAETAGVAHGLGVAPREALRATFALDAASTVFAATRSATADGGPLLGRNADWGDAGGLRRPLVVHYDPEGDALRYVAARWALNPLFVVGLNEAGFALSFNYFDTEPLMTTVLPSWPHRRALQEARTVEEGVEVFRSARRLGMSCFMVMADARGDLAMVECRPGDGCAVFRPEGDWFAQANHARTPAMIPHDRYRHPDSFARLAGMEAAVAPHVGALTPELAARILRDRSGHAYPNGSSVGNLYVLNAVVVQPAKGLLWHATSMQPYAPFGAYRAFVPTGAPAGVPDLPADPAFASGAMAREREAVATARRAVAFQKRGRPAAARPLWDALAAQDPPALDPARIALGRAQTLFDLDDLQGAFDALAPAATPEAPFEARLHALLQRGLLADALGRRRDATALYADAVALADGHPEYTAFGALRERAAKGLEARQDAADLPLDWWAVGVPR